jgi:hypothetical protein
MKVLRACVLTAGLATTLSLGASVALLGEDSTVRETRDRHEWLLTTPDVTAKD